MREIFERYIKYLEVEHNASPYTVRNYRTDLLGTYERGIGKGFFQFLLLQNIDSLRPVERSTIRDYVAWLMGRDTARSSIARKLSAIRSFYRYLLQEEIVKTSPIPVHTRGRRGERSSLSPKLDKRIPSFLTPLEMSQLLQAPDLSRPEGKRNNAIIELFYASGIRVSELYRLNLEDADTDNREVRVLGKGSKERVVLIGIPAADAIKEYLNQVRPEIQNRYSEQALFLSRNGKRLGIRNIQKLVTGYAHTLGLEKRVHPHTLRHTFATHLLDGGADLRVVQELLGHADLSSTQIYTHVTKAQARKIYLAAHPMAKERTDENGLSETTTKSAPEV